MGALADIPAFHLAFTVRDLDAAEAFYVTVLGARAVARDGDWLVLDFYGHKLTATRADTAPEDDLALRHFGLMLTVEDFAVISDRLVAAGADIVLPAELRDAGTPRACWVMFVRDPTGNGLEFNAFPESTWQGHLC